MISSVLIIFFLAAFPHTVDQRDVGYAEKRATASGKMISKLVIIGTVIACY